MKILPNKTIESLAKAENCNPIGVKKVAEEIAERIWEFQMETETEKALLIAYLNEIIELVKNDLI
jgi:hypothetical protein